MQSLGPSYPCTMCFAISGPGECFLDGYYLEEHRELFPTTDPFQLSPACVLPGSPPVILSGGLIGLTWEPAMLNVKRRLTSSIETSRLIQHKAASNARSISGCPHLWQRLSLVFPSCAT